MNRPVIVIGAGGHARVVADALQAAGHHVLGHTDMDRALHGTEVCGLPVLGSDSVLDRYPPDSIDLANGLGGVGIAGQALYRSQVQERLTARGWRFVTVRHPSAVVSRSSSIAEGVQLMATSVVQAGARVAEGAIVNTAAVVEHDAVVGPWAHVAPRALLCGGVSVGPWAHIGAGAVVRQGVRIGQGAVIGAGAVVLGDCDSNQVLIGVPARPRKEAR